MISCGANDIASSVQAFIEGTRKERRAAWVRLLVLTGACAGTLAFYLHRIEVRLAVVETKIDTHMIKVAER